MAYEDFRQKDSVVVVYTGDGKGKTSASIGLTARALGRGWKVAYIQFIKHWTVGEHDFFQMIQPVFERKLLFYKGGKGFFNAPDGIAAKDVSQKDHIDAARKTYQKAYNSATNGKYDLVVCDEINNAVHDGLLSKSDLKRLISDRHPKTSLCITGRNFPDELVLHVDIATDMRKLRHHFDDKYLANKGIDY